jgi:hypothetical protein
MRHAIEASCTMKTSSLLLTCCLAAWPWSAWSTLPAKPDCAPFSLPGLKLTWVAPDVVHNGLPLQIRHFETRDPVLSVLARYRQEWRATERYPGEPLEYDLRGYRVIAKMRDRCFYTVQIRPGAIQGSEGLLGVSEIHAGFQVPELGQDFPKMSGSQVAADMSHRDPGKSARTIMLMNQFSVDANADFYRRVLGGDGWHVISDHKVPLQGGNGHTFALTFKRGLHETSMVIARTQGGSSVLVNQVDKP